MNSVQLREIIDEIIRKEGGDIQSIATKADVDRSYLSKIINSGTMVELKGRKLIPGLKRAFPAYFENNIKQHLAPGTVSSDDHIKTLNRHNIILEEVIKANLTALQTTQQIILAQIQAGQKYGARRDSKGNKKQEDSILNEINTFAAEYFGSLIKAGNGRHGGN